jgi:AAA domain (dynein-related subfamily)
MRASEITASLQAIIPTLQPVYIVGPPGCGKSSIVQQAARAMDMKFIDVRAVLLDPVDLRGLPYMKDGRACWATPDFLPTEGAGVLFLDELGQAPPLVQAALLQLILDRKIGDYELPEKWAVVAASNRAEDRAGGHRMITPLLNRFLHLDMEVSNEDWDAWAAGAGSIAGVIRSFLKFRPKLLFDFDPTTNPRAFPTPRSWAFVNTILPNTPDALMHQLVAGCIGQGPAVEFTAFHRIWKSLPDVDGILAAPASAMVPQAPDVLYAVCGAIAEKCKTVDDKKLAAAVKYAKRLPKEFSVLMMRDSAAANKRIVSTDDFQGWIRENRNLIIDK